MPEGDTGAPRFGGAAQSDAFTNRERASEDAFIRQREAEKFAALKKQKAADAGSGGGSTSQGGATK